MDERTELKKQAERQENEIEAEMADLSARLRQCMLDKEAEDYAPGTNEMSGDWKHPKAIGNPEPRPGTITDEEAALRQWEEETDRPGSGAFLRQTRPPELLYTDGEIREPALQGDVGYDLLVKALMWVPASSFAHVPLEAKVAIPHGYWGLVIAKLLAARLVSQRPSGAT